MTSTIPPWSPDDFDRKILADRTAAKKAVLRPAPQRRLMNRTVDVAPGKPRGEATDEELQRRKIAARRIKEDK